jgi:enoyl-CoA hydratase/carnithine racemase
LALVDVDDHERVATLTLNRPEARNALSVELCDAIVGALSEIEALDARAVIVKGAGSVFCSGADFAAVAGHSGLDFLPAFERMLESVARFRLPTIAAIQGAALGGGLQLATVCDFRIAASDANLGIPSSRLGIVVNFENVQRLALLVGIAHAKEVLMTGRTYSGRDRRARPAVRARCQEGPASGGGPSRRCEIEPAR